MQCESLGCDDPGYTLLRRDFRGDVVCDECGRTIVRCVACWARFRKLEVCPWCSGSVKKTFISAGGHNWSDGDWDIDANGWAANARRLLEDLPERPIEVEQWLGA